MRFPWDSWKRILAKAWSWSGKQTFSSTDGISLAGAGSGLTMRPMIDIIPQIAHAVPVQVTYGVHKGFTMPIWNAGANVNEQLFAGGTVPKRWEGASNFTVRFVASLSGGEDVGDKFQFRLLWDPACCDGTIVNTYVTAPKEITVLAGRNGQYSNYCVDFTIVYNTVDHVVCEDALMGMILQRIAASASEVDNDIIIWQHGADFRYPIDRVYGAF